MVKRNSFYKNLGLSLLSGGLVVGLAACSKSSGGSDASSGLSVSGTLTINSASGVTNPVQKFQSAFSTTGTSLSLDCGSSGVFNATVDPTTGAFSTSGVPTGVPCTFSFVNSTSGVTKCQVQFQDASSYDLNHNPMSTSTASISSNVNLGSITCDTTGNITVPSSSVANINSSSSVSSSSAFDFTGVWTAAIYDGALGPLPTGYKPIVSCSSNCQGPTPGMNISLVRFHGYKFTPNSGQCTPAMNVTCPASDGTVDTNTDGYGMSIWGGDYAHGIGACGGNTGFTADEARAYAGISLDATPPTLDGNQLSYAHYSWSTPTGFGGDTGWTKPWMYTGATSQWDVMDCQPVSVPSTTGGVANKQGWACFASTQNGSGPTGVYVWNVGLGNSGGCVDTNNNPVMVTNWTNLTGSCSSTPSSFNSNLTTNTCTYTGAAVAGQASSTFTCSFTGGSFKDLANTTTSSSNNAPDFTNPYTMPSSTWPGQPAILLAKNATCEDSGNAEATLITTATGGGSPAAKAAAAKELLVRYQCYANQYWQHSSNGAGSTSCSRDYNFDWSTNDYTKFVLGDDRSMKPQNAFITDRVFYSTDGQWAFLKNVDTRFESFPTASGSQLCPMKNIVELKFKRVSDNKIFVDFTQNTVMADNSATCQGAVTAALAGNPDLAYLKQELQPTKFIFYLTK